MGGFSLIETIVVIVLIGIVAVIFIPQLRSFKLTNDIEVAFNGIINSIKRAQIKAVSSESDSSWGAKIQAGKVTIFQGSDFTTRNAALDEIVIFPTSVTVAGLNEIFFSKFSGLSSATGPISLSIDGVLLKVLNINEKGVINF